METNSRQRTPTQCRRHLRKAVVAEFDDLIEGFLKEARKGSCAHMKLAIELLRPEPRQPAAATGKSFMQRLLEDLERDETAVDLDVSKSIALVAAAD